MIYYKRNIDDNWKGPAKVINQDGPGIFYGTEDSSSKPNVSVSKPKTYMMKQAVL